MIVELAWAAGFFDGEGSTHVSHSSPTTAQIVMKVSQAYHEPLNRFCKAVGLGKVRGPYKKPNPKHRDYYTWSVGSQSDVRAVGEKLWPYLCSPKREQLIQAFHHFLQTPHPGIGAPGYSRCRAA